MSKESSKPFRPDNVGAKERLIHWRNATAVLLLSVIVGLPGLLAYGLFLLVFHSRPDRVRGANLMESLLRTRRHVLAAEWNEFARANHRRTMLLAGRRPHRFLAIAVHVGLFLLSGALFAQVGDALDPQAIAARLGIAMAISTALWVSYFGLSRRTPIVFGVDGFRVRETFVAYASLRGIERQGDRVVVQRSDSSPSTTLRTSDEATAERLVDLLASERSHALQRRTELSSPLPSAGFRESASHEGWRVRLLDAPSDEDRHAVMVRVAPDELRELLDETADPSLEAELGAHLRKSR